MFSNIGTVFNFIIIYYLIINIALFSYMGYDKNLAKKNKYRVPESNLIIVSFLGGAVGGYIGMYTFNHKKNKFYFHIIFVISIIQNISLLHSLYVLTI